MISPKFLVPKAHQVRWAMLLLTNRTLPSLNDTFAPPGWLLAAWWYPLSNWKLFVLASSLQSAQRFCGLLGVMSVLKTELPRSP